VGKYDSKTGEMGFGKGGNQGARGDDKGGDYFIENVMEELDSPGEFYYDSKTSKLYLFYNSSTTADAPFTPPPAALGFIAPQIPMLVNVSGTQANPVKGVSFAGITFSSTRYTYMGPHYALILCPPPGTPTWALTVFLLLETGPSIVLAPSSCRAQKEWSSLAASSSALTATL
jgi:hypothetical protein